MLVSFSVLVPQVELAANGRVSAARYLNFF